MQNVDFYDGKQNNKFMNKQFINTNTENPDLYSKVSNTNNNKEEEKFRKKAIRIIFMISAISIISFTTGLAIGIKFAGGANKEIVDKETFNALSKVKQNISSIISKPNQNNKIKVKTRFPKNEFPYVIKIGTNFTKLAANQIANTLSKKGHTVIISKSGSKFKVYTGPYKSKTQANTSSHDISLNKKISSNNIIKIIHRT